jgi:hypothetical protein
VSRKKSTVGPRCPKCGNIPYDIVHWERPDKGPPIKSFRWFCPDGRCNPDGIIMMDEEVWDIEF